MYVELELGKPWWVGDDGAFCDGCFWTLFLWGGRCLGVLFGGRVDGIELDGIGWGWMGWDWMGRTIRGQPWLGFSGDAWLGVSDVHGRLEIRVDYKYQCLGG